MDKEFKEKAREAGKRLGELMDIYDPYVYVERVVENGNIVDYVVKFKKKHSSRSYRCL